MRRSPDQLAATDYDVVIVGGGIYGACAAREAALQGLSVALLERDDFGSRTSANSLKIMHGGLRYLQNLDLKRMRESIRERRALGRLAPHLVRPMPFVIPCYGHALRGPEVMRVALLLNELISADRNRGIPRERQVPRGRTLSRQRLQTMIPDLPEPGLTGGAMWYDGQATNTERLLLAFVQDAVRHGAEVANYTEVVGFLEKDAHVAGVQAVDRVSGRSLEVRGRVVLNAAGPWVDRLLSTLREAKPDRQFVMSKGMNLVTRQLFADFGAAIPFQETYEDRQAPLDKGKLHFFAVPWRGHSLIGTRHLPWDGDPDAFRVEETDVRRFLDEINRAYPTARLERSDVVRVYEGMLPALTAAGDTGGDDVQIGKQFRITDHASTDGIEGLVSVVGVKWTTARDVSERALRVVLDKLGRKATVDSSTGPLPGGDFEDWSALVDRIRRRVPQLPTSVPELLAERYGSRVDRVLDTDRGSLELLGGPIPVLEVEVATAADDEMVVRLADAVLRRTELGAAGNPGTTALERAAEIVGAAQNWSREERHREIDHTLAEWEDAAWARKPS